MKRVLFFTGYRMTVYHWQGKRLLKEYSFSDTPESLEEFAGYLRLGGHQPVHLLEDLVEEELSLVEQPHLRGRERTLYSQRQAERLFRGTPYCFFQVQRRRKAQRKEDVVLYSGITNPDLLSPWIERIEQAAIPIVGISSLSLLSAVLIKRLELTDDKILLLSQQTPSYYRHTYISKGQVQFTRLASISQGDKPNEGAFVSAEVCRTLAFLRARHYVTGTDVVRAVVLIPDHLLEPIRVSLAPGDRQQYTLVGLAQIARHLGLKAAKGDFSDNIFSYLAGTATEHRNHYAKAPLLKPYRQHQIRTGLYFTSIMIALGSIFTALSLVSDVYLAAKNIPFIKQQREIAASYYADRYTGVEAQISQASRIETAVAWDRYFSSIDYPRLPATALRVVSQILEQDKLSLVTLESIDWFLNERPSLTQSDSMTISGHPGAEVGVSSLPDAHTPNTPSNELTATSRGQHEMRLRGRIKVTPDNYREMLDQITLLKSELEATAIVSAVTVEEVPVDVSPYGAVTGAAGSSVGERDESRKKGRFTLLIRFLDDTT